MSKLVAHPGRRCLVARLNTVPDPSLRIGLKRPLSVYGLGLRTNPRYGLLSLLDFLRSSSDPPPTSSGVPPGLNWLSLNSSEFLRTSSGPPPGSLWALSRVGLINGFSCHWLISLIIIIIIKTHF